MIDSLIIQINSKCNIDCNYCYSKNKFKDKKEEIEKSIKKIINKWDIKSATITGGEPLLDYSFLTSILNRLFRRGIKVNVITNGLLLNRSMLEEFQKLNTSVIISLDSIKGSKKPSKKLTELIKDNKRFLKIVSKVITKNNLKYVYRDVVDLSKLGFKEIEIIPQMYTYWNKKEIELMINEIKKVIVYCKNKRIKNNFLEETNKKRYYKCNKIRVLPDGSISLCNSLNCNKKNKFISNEELKRFEEFRKNIIVFALNSCIDKKRFKKEWLNNLCIVDLFYDVYINKKEDKLIFSAMGLFKKIDDIIKA